MQSTPVHTSVSMQQEYGERNKQWLLWEPATASDWHDSVVSTCIQDGADVNATLLDGCSPLFHAVQMCNVKSVDVLLKAGADPHATDVFGNTLCHTAVVCQATEGLRLLIDAGMNVDVRNEHGCSSLHYTVPDAILGASTDADCADIVKILVAAGADVDSADMRGHTPVWRSVAARCPVVTKTLIEAGASVSQRLVELSRAAAATATPGSPTYVVAAMVTAAAAWPTSARCIWITSCVQGGGDSLFS